MKGEGVMKKVLYGFLTIGLIVPFFVGAVPPPWTGDSNPFQWTGGMPVLNDNHRALLQVTLQCRQEFSNGTVTILYDLPTNVSGARLFIYSVSGSLIKDFKLEPGKGKVRWSASQDKVAAGVYVASMRYGTADKKIQIAIVK
jgi:hypothetical protein